MSAQASSRCVRSSSMRCALSSAAMRLNASTQPLQLVGRAHGNARIEVAPRDPPRCARQAIDRIGDALRHREADRRAEQDEDDAPPDTRRDRDRRSPARSPAARGASGTVRIASRSPRRTGRRREHVRMRADRVVIDEARKAIEDDGAIDLRRRARGQQARLEQIALARGHEPAARRRC